MAAHCGFSSGAFSTRLTIYKLYCFLLARYFLLVRYFLLARNFLLEIA